MDLAAGMESCHDSTPRLTLLLDIFFACVRCVIIAKQVYIARSFPSFLGLLPPMPPPNVSRSASNRRLRVVLTLGTTFSNAASESSTTTTPAPSFSGSTSTVSSSVPSSRRAHACSPHAQDLPNWPGYTPRHARQRPSPRRGPWLRLVRKVCTISKRWPINVREHIKPPESAHH